MKTYLVTGGAGFIGSNFIHYCLKKYPDDIIIICYDKLTYAGNLDNLKDVMKNKNFVFVHGDICDTQLVKTTLEKYNVNYIINFAAESHVDRSINNPKNFIDTNIVGTFNLLQCAKVYWQTGDDFYRDGVKFLQISTDEVYGSLSENAPAFTEKKPICPHNPYSSSKASADMLVKVFYDTYKFPINITRCSNNYGPYQYPEKLIPLMFEKAKNKEKLPVYGTGLNIRDWLYVEDHCSAIDLVLRKGKIGEIYNIGGNNQKTNLYIINYIIKFLQENIDPSITSDLISFVPDRKGHDFKYAIDSSKLQKELGWSPLTKFEEGMIKTLNWYLQNTEWLHNIKTNKHKKRWK